MRIIHLPRSRLFISSYTSKDQVHIWCASQIQELQQLEELYSLLSRDERARADEYCFERDRNRFIARRGLLRTILGLYTGISPSGLEFSYGACGKPFLKTKTSDPKVQFSVSHSNNMVLYAVSWDRCLGIDIEYIRPMPAAAQIAEQFFSIRESNWIQSLPIKERLEAFFDTWVCKEAYLKAVGIGLAGSLALDKIDIMSFLAENTQNLSIEGNGQETAHWQLKMIREIPGYIAAIVVAGLDCQITFRELTDL